MASETILNGVPKGTLAFLHQLTDSKPNAHPLEGVRKRHYFGTGTIISPSLRLPLMFPPAGGNVLIA